MGSGENSVVRAPDSWSKGCGFDSPQERWENFLLQGQLSGLALSPGSNFWTGSFSGVNFLDWLFLRGQLSGLALSPGSSFWTGSFSRVNFLDWLFPQGQVSGLALSPGSSFWTGSCFGIHSTPVLPQQNVKDPSHSTKSAGSRLQLSTL